MRLCSGDGVTCRPSVAEMVNPANVVRRDLTGEWRRTDCHSSQYGTVTIFGQTEVGVSVAAECAHFFHMGFLEGFARFTGEHTAILTMDADEDVDEDECVAQAQVTFQWEGERLRISSGANGAALGFGADVTIDGAYILAEPSYTNAGVLQRCLTPEQQEIMQTLLGENYDTYLRLPLMEGFVSEPEDCHLPDGTRAICYEVYFPTTADYSLVLLVAEDGRIYFENSIIGFYSNDPAAESMPLIEE